MKSRVFLFLLFCPVVSLAARGGTVGIKAEIRGLQVGDTLVFSFHEPAPYEMLSRDTLYVERAGRFALSKKLDRTAFMTMRYLPVDHSDDLYVRIPFVVRPGDRLKLRGEAGEGMDVAVEGGFYGDPSVGRLFDLENDYRLSGADTLEQQADSLKKHIRNEADYSEFAAALFLDELEYVDYARLTERYASLAPEVKKSDMGRKMEELIRIWASLRPGEEAPDFMVTAAEGRTVSLSDYRGKYLLVYCWQFCPTTFQVQARVKKLYEKYGRDTFDVLAITPDDPRKEVLGISVAGNPEETARQQKIALDAMRQPWSVAYTKRDANRFMVKKYYIWNADVLTFIGPDGRIIARSYLTDLE